MARALALFRGSIALGGLLLLIPAQPMLAAKRPATIETSLLGIRILSSYNTVLAKYGQPTRIYRKDENVNFENDFDANGNPTGGVRGLGDGTAGPGMAGRGGGFPGMMASQGGGSMPGAMMRAGGGSSFPSGGMMSGGGSSFPGGGGMMGSGAGKQGGMAAMPGMGGMGGMPGMGGGGRGMPGMGGGLGANGAQGGSATFGDSGGFQWVYFYPRQELVYWFIFNKDGRVEAIIERGRYLGQKTARGLGLGDAAKAVYNTYGWPDSVEQQGYTIAMKYPLAHHVQLNILRNKVTTVAVFLSETERYFTDDGGSGGGGPGMGGMMGRPGMAGGMMGRGGMRGSMMGGPAMSSGGGGGGKAD